MVYSDIYLPWISKNIMAIADGSKFDHHSSISDAYILFIFLYDHFTLAYVVIDWKCLRLSRDLILQLFRYIMTLWSCARDWFAQFLVSKFRSLKLPPCQLLGKIIYKINLLCMIEVAGLNSKIWLEGPWTFEKLICWPSKKVGQMFK